MKNRYKYLIVTSLFVSALTGCSKLEQLPSDKLSVETTFTDEFGFQTYAWQFYDAFPAYGRYSEDGGQPYSIGNDINSDFLARSVDGGQSAWIAKIKQIPNNDDFYNSVYYRLRTIYTMLENIDKSAMSEDARNHWKAVCYFFRAYNYIDLVNLYGDVPYINHKLTDKEEDLYKDRTPRETIVKSILEDLDFAVANLRKKDNGAYLPGSNAITPDAALALISRFCLREGTWRKYHKDTPQPSPLTTEANFFLEKSAEASKKLMQAYPTLGENYDLDFNSENLAGRPGIILYKAYGGDGTDNIFHDFASRQSSRHGYLDLTKVAVDHYLCTDGLPTKVSPLFQGDKNAYDEFRNRDQRLYYTVPPPYRVILKGSLLREFDYTDDPRDTSYFSIMRSLSDDVHKTLPLTTGGGRGNSRLIGIEPTFFKIPLDPESTNFQNTFTGYRLYKYSNDIGSTGIAKISDAPIFRMGEILVNYAEAMYELGQFSQTIADQTINKTRERGKVAPLNIANITNDPNRDEGVTPLLWEIRRERSVELMGEGFRFDDLRRWKKMSYAMQPKLGRYVIKGKDHVPANANIPIDGGGNEGYVLNEPKPSGEWPTHYYLYPIPSSQISIYEAIGKTLSQNPGWK